MRIIKNADDTYTLIAPDGSAQNYDSFIATVAALENALELMRGRE